MFKTGIADLGLCRGPIPHYKQMVELAAPILGFAAEELGTAELLKRFSNPCWYQCYACTLGFEHNMCGATTVVLKATKESLEQTNLPLKIAGGKGRESRKAPAEIMDISDRFNLSQSKTGNVSHASRLSPKVDSSEVQDGYQLYFHSTMLDEKGNWCIINQGMNSRQEMTRRYHWLSGLEDFVEEPHSSILGRTEDIVMNLASRDSRENRETVLDIVQDNRPKKIERMVYTIDRRHGQKKLFDFLPGASVVKAPPDLRIPKRIALEALERARKASRFEELLSTPGIGPATVRGLSYVAELVYGAPVNWKDPISFTHAYGTKASVPYFVEKEEMTKSAEFLRQAVEEARVGDREKVRALKRLERFVDRK